MGKNEIVTARQPNKLTALTSENLPETTKRYLELHYGYRKVRDYTEEDLKGLFKFILALCKLIGVTEAPDTEIVILLLNHIQTHHKDFSKEEIQNAFGLAMAGKLEFEFVHYNRITPQLISNTLNKYKMIRGKEIIAFERKQQEKKDEEKRIKKPQTPDEEKQMRIRSCISSFEQYKREKSRPPEERLVIRDWGGMNYNYLDSIGLIKFNKDEIEEIHLDAQKKSKDKDLGGLIQSICSNDSKTVSKRKQISLDRYYDRLILQKKTLKDEIGNVGI